MLRIVWSVVGGGGGEGGDIGLCVAKVILDGK